MSFPANPSNGRIHKIGNKTYIWTARSKNWSILPFSSRALEQINKGVLDSISSTSESGDGTRVNDHNATRSNRTTGIAPDNTEVPDPTEGDTAKIQLDDGSVEFWEYDISWSLIFSIPSEVDDQSAAGYIDIGNVRIQFGTVSGGSVSDDVVFSAPFATNTYSIVTTVLTAVAGKIFVANINTKSTTQFRYDKVVHDNVDAAEPEGALAEAFDWQAIGIKPNI